MLRRACAKTKTLATLPASCARGWICAVAFAVVAVILLLTVIGNTTTGGANTPEAPLDPLNVFCDMELHESEPELVVPVQDNMPLTARGFWVNRSVQEGQDMEELASLYV